MATVALIGRRNVGKSTLFNRLTGQSQAIISKIAGTTRDRLSGQVFWSGRTFELLDTGGLDLKNKDVLEVNITKQAIKAIKSANLILLVVDVQNGILAADTKILKQLYSLNFTSKKIILVANKADSQKIILTATNQCYKLGLPEIVFVSALNGLGTGDLLDLIIQHLPAITTDTPLPRTKVAIIGKPNVGKSSLINALVNDERMIVTELPHTTRDAQAIKLKYLQEEIILIDTAGIRRKADKTILPLEHPSITKSFLAIKQADIVVLLLAGQETPTFQDHWLAHEIVQQKKPLIIAINKWDLISPKNSFTLNQYQKYFYSQLSDLTWAPMIFLSATEKIHLTKLLQLIMQIKNELTRKLTADELAIILARLKKDMRLKPKSSLGKIKLLNCQQIEGQKLPCFEFKFKAKVALPPSVKALIVKNIYRLGFTGLPLTIKIND